MFLGATWIFVDAAIIQSLRLLLHTHSHREPLEENGMARYSGHFEIKPI
jgi:hypothetical protein